MSTPEMTPQLSVVIPCFRQAHFLPDALKSVLGRPGLDVEALVVDDGSPDDVAAACASFGPAVKVIRQENCGLSAARNAGVAAARGTFVHCLDADDWVSPDFVTRMTEELDAHPKWATAVCRSLRVGGPGERTRPHMEPPPTGCPLDGLRRRNLFPVGAVVFRRNLIERVGTFDPTLRSCEDWDFWIRIARTGGLFGRVDGPVFYYRTQAGGMSQNGLGMFEASADVLRRARNDDPRIAGLILSSSPDIPGELEACIALAAAGCMGKALASRDAADVRSLFERLLELCPQGVGPEHWSAMLSEASVGLGASDPCSPLVWEACWVVLMELQRTLPEESPVRAALPKLARGLSGVMEVQRERTRWEANYLRLAKAFPLRQLLWLRRRAMGIPEAPDKTGP
jgi:glycosyltransferase involved in cell wall biosynthesis